MRVVTHSGYNRMNQVVAGLVHGAKGRILAA